VPDAVSWAAWLEASALGEWMRASALAYPVANVIHLFGLVLLVGPIALLDVRLLGFAREFDLSAASRVLTRVAVAGFILLAAAGFLMFAADAKPLAAHTLMQAKLVLILTGLLNALVFRQLWRSRLTLWDSNPPTLGRVQALASIAIWTSVATLGRWIAYA
jgi:hypothetical protein